MLVENLGGKIDAVLDPVLARAVYRKEDCAQLANPQYRPGLIAQYTLITFISMEKRLEDQLLVVFLKAAIEKAEASALQEAWLGALRAAVRLTIHTWVVRGLLRQRTAAPVARCVMQGAARTP